MSSPFSGIAGQFSALAAICAGSAALAKVTVTSVDPDSGADGTVAANVDAIKRVQSGGPTAAGGGEVGVDSCRFVLRADQVGFSVKTRDRVTDAGGTAWKVLDANLIAFGQLYTVNVTKQR